MVRLEARELYRFFHSGDSESFALRGVSLMLSAGEMVALVGPSGSGKSTLLSCLTGLEVPDGGAVFIDGEAISRRPEAVRARLRAKHMGIMMQSGNLFEHLTVADNIRLQQWLAGVKGKGLNFTEQLGISDRAHRPPSELSGGETARAALAVALAAAAGIVICDEPTAEVDSGTERAIFDVLRSERERGAAILVATHSRALAEFSDRLITIVDGRIK
jgi:putative ABC transport system ATP-binding protein